MWGKKGGPAYGAWTPRARDAETPGAGPDELFRPARDTPADRSRIVLLLHDGAHRQNTVAALKKIIRYYKEQGYEFRTL